MLARLRRRFPDAGFAGAIDRLFAAQFTAEKIAGEVASLSRPSARGFERPYGWAWLLMLASELARHSDGAGQSWRHTLTPLTAAFVERFKAFLPLADYPVRTGAHGNTAFALILARDYCDVCGDDALAHLCENRARAWYAGDAGCQAWEPSQDDFLSPALSEAALMSRVMAPEEFGLWFARFLPRLEGREPATLFAPARVSARSDGKIVHLDGLNLSRAWCWRLIASCLPGDPVAGLASDAAERHLAASLPHVTGDYMGEHWLASFAVLALDPDPD
jgi:hypothetical protein